MSCTFKSTKAGTSLRRKVGSDSALFNALISTVTTEVNGSLMFTDDFINYYHKYTDANKTPIVGDESNESNSKIASTIIDYYNDGHINVNNDSDSTYFRDQVSQFGYRSTSDKIYALKAIGNNMRQLYIDDIDKGVEINKETLLNDLAIRVRRRLAIKLAKEYLDLSFKNKEDRKAYMAELNNIVKAITMNTTQKPEVFSVIKSYFNDSRHQDNVTYQQKNLLAVLLNIDSDNGRTFFNEVLLSNPALGEIAFRNETIDELNNDLDTDKDLVDDENFDNTDSEDVLTREELDQNHWDENGGMTSNFMKGFSSKIRNYLGLIPKLTDYNTPSEIKKDKNGNEKKVYKYQYNRDNPLGLVDYLDTKQVAAILNSKVNRDNINSFIESIRDAAHIPGMEGLIKVYNDLNDNYDFAQQFMREFKTIVTKYETRVDEEAAKLYRSNGRTNAEQVVALGFLNDIKYTTLSVSKEEIADKINALKDNVEAGVKMPTLYESGSSNFYNDVVSEFKELYNIYYPSMDNNAIDTFIRCENAKDSDHIITNINTLMSVLDSTIAGADLTQAKNREQEDKRKAIDEELKKIRGIRKPDAMREQLKDKLKNAKGESEIQQIYKDYNKELDEKELNLNVQKGESFGEEIRSDGSVAAAMEAARILSPYSIVNIELNSRNALGNLQSDIINSSMLTYLTNIMNAKELSTDKDGKTAKLSLINFGEFKFKNSQYKLSNILVEKRNPSNNKIINYGLFRYDDKAKAYVVTSYADKLLNIGLFNGASAPEAGKGITYSQMSEGDYVYTAFSNFFNSDKDIDAGRITRNDSAYTINLANYFMRTPSDAPKTFVVRMPRYKIDKDNKIIVIDNEKELRDAAIKYADGRTTMTDVKNLGKTKFINLNTDRETINRIKDDFNSNRSGKIIRTVYENQFTRDPRYASANKGWVGYEIKDENDKVSRYIVYGDYEVKNNRVTISKGTAFLVGESNQSKFDNDIFNILVKDIYNKGIRRGQIGDTPVNKTINKEHPIYKQFRAIFDQEILNMAEFANKYFDKSTDTDGRIYIAREDGKPKYKDSNVDKNNFYALYHIGKGATDIFAKNKNGVYGFTGNLFHSDRFTITDYNTGETTNYGQDLLNAYFGGLYGEINKGDLAYSLNETGDVELAYTDEQAAAVDNMISDFINDYVRNNLYRMDEYKNLDISGQINDDNVAEFALNYRLAYTNFNDLVEGDTKFYKSSQDFLKRAKEGQASGVPYSTFNIYQKLTENITDMSNMSKLNLKATQDRLKAIGLNITQRTGFKAVTVKNTVRTSKEAAQNGPIVQELKALYIKQGYNEEVALKLANKHMDGFQGTKVNDAQSYITFEEWIRRVAGRGQLDEYMPLIEAIQDRSKPVPTDLLKKFVQVQKNFYYDLHYDNHTNTHVPRQIKNAEFVLVPRFIEGTQLEDVYNAMIENGIDQLNTVETSKAGKARVMELFDSKTGDISSHIEDFRKNAKGYAEDFYYQFLYTQQETPQHLDAENKAGIQIMKKILDNIPEFILNDKGEKVENPTYKYKEDFFNMYTANIKDSFNKLAKELNVPLDENGNIKIDENGNIQGLNMNIFFKNLRRECLRQGLDSNILEYFTLNTNAPLQVDGRPNTVMDTYMTNMLTKVQNVCQSMFNNAITRQTLPGFHAAQITNVGFKSNGGKLKYVLKENGKGRNLKDVLTSEEFKNLDIKNQMYYEKQAGQVSYSKELRYHPTITDENGNTKNARYIEIMLPKSNFSFAKDENGNYIRNENETDEELDARLLKQLQDEGLDEIIGYRIPTEGKQSICIMKVVGFIDDTLGSTIVVPDDWVSQTGSDFDIDSVYGIQFATTINANGEIQKVLYNDLAGKSYDDYVKSNLNDEAKNKLQDAIKAGVNETTALANVAQEYGLQSREEFSESKDLSGENSRNARNNRILEDMLKILQSDDAFEENTGQSQFKDVIDARDEIISSRNKDIRNNRSCFDFIDQAKYQDDVMSGAKLKAFSVTRDTFVSICNTVRPKIDQNWGIRIKYDGYDNNELKARFNDRYENVTDDNVVNHVMFGYSRDNHNVDGMILTAYSSETTAHILDAVKEGAIPNVNDYTFGVYKTFVDVGSNFRTAISFIAHPGVTRIVEAYNANKSIYTEDSSRPVEEALKSIARDAGINTDNLYSLKSIVTALNDKFERNYKVNENNKIVLNANELKTDVALEDKCDLGKQYDIIMAYRDIQKLTDLIQDTVRVCNPDRFGAKQSIFATNDVFNRIYDIATDEKRSKMLYVENEIGEKTTFLKTIYPGLINSENRIDKAEYFANRDKSAYPSLNAFLKYASTSSTLINSMLFDTQRPYFIQTVKGLRRAFSSPRNLTEKEYNDYEKYIIGECYAKSDGLRLGFTIDSSTGGLQFTNTTDTQEKLRIYGFNKTRNIKFKVESFTHPTQDEINQWAELSPAQKVAWIQANAYDTGIFGKLKVDLHDTYKVGNKMAPAQNIRFDDDAVDVETAYSLFDTAANSRNPLIKLAAIDLIKYSFVVEGFKMRRNAVNKIIKNSVLRDDTMFLNADGTSSSLMQQIRSNFDTIGMYDPLENYVRSHPNSSFIPHKTMKKKRVGKVWVEELQCKSSLGMLIQLNVPQIEDDIYLAARSEEIAEAENQSTVSETDEDTPTTNDKKTDKKEEAKDDSALASKYGLYDKNTDRNIPYTTLTRKVGENNVTFLYKTVRYGNNLFAYPLNIIDENEHETFSVNKANNPVNVYNPEFYKIIIDNEIRKIEEGVDAKDLLTSDAISELSKKYKSDVNIANIKDTRNFDINEYARNGNFGAKTAINIIKNAIASGETGVIRFKNMFLYDRIGYNTGNVQTITGTYIDTDGNEKEINKRYAFHKAYDIHEGKKFSVEPNLVIATPVKEKADSSKTVAPKEDISNTPMESSTIEYEFEMYKDISRRAENGDATAYKEIHFLEDLGFTGLSADFETKQSDTYDMIDRYTRARVNKLITDRDQFIKDENGNWLSIFDPKTMAIIRNKPAEQRRFLKFVLDTDALIKKFGGINDVLVDDNLPDEIKDNIASIKNSISNLQNKVNVNQLYTRFARELLAKWSDDPKIQNEIVDILNGFHATSWLDAWIGDLQDSGNSLVQVITKHMMADIRAKEKVAQDESAKFVKDINDIIKSSNEPVDWSKLVDKDGTLIRDYTKEFEHDLREEVNKVNEARLDIENNPLEYVKRKHHYDLFKLNYINQIFKDEYYSRRYELDNDMIEKHPIIFAEYNKLKEQIRNVNKHRENGVLPPEYETKYKALRYQLYNLSSEFDPNTGQYKEEYYDSVPGTREVNGQIEIVNEEVYRIATLNNIHSAKALQSYLGKIKDLEAEYNDFETKDGFEETLDKMLDIVEKAEKRDPSGYKTVSDDTLNDDERYKRAKAWLDTNASWRVSKDVTDKIAAAFNVLMQDNPKKGTITNTEKRRILSQIRKEGKRIVYDNTGALIGTAFNENEIKAIKKDEEGRYMNTNYAAGNDNILISNKPAVRRVYPMLIYNSLLTGGLLNQDYLNIVKDINKILLPYYDTTKKEVTFTRENSRMSIEELEELDKLYSKLRETRKHIPDIKGDEKYRGKSVADFINRFFTDDCNKEKFDTEYTKAKNIGGEYLALWEKVNMEYQVAKDAEGNVLKDSDGKIIYDTSLPKIPNRYLYSNLVLKEQEFIDFLKDGPAKEKFIRELNQRNEALDTVNTYLEKSLTPYYTEAMTKARHKGEEYFKEWYNNNHVWNPYSHRYEPIGIWQKTSIVPKLADGHWEPTYNQQQIVPKEQYKNTDYKGIGSSNLSNYKKHPYDDKYSSGKELNETEQDIKDLIESTLLKYTKDKKSRRFVEEGNLPRKQKDPEQTRRQLAKEFAEFLGWNPDIAKVGSKDLFDNISYSRDYIPTMPMLFKEIKTKASANLAEIKRNAPKREEYTNDEDYNKALEEHNKRVEEAEKLNQSIHEENLNKDWVNNIAEFITLAGHFNAIQDNKYLFYYLQNMIKQEKVYENNLGFFNYRKDRMNSTTDKTSYIKKTDERLYEQLSNWGSRLLFDSYKLPNNFYTKASNILQSITSAKFMMLNITGGIGNVTVGRSAIFGEHIAKDFFGTKDWEAGKRLWYSSVMSFVRGLYSDDSTSLADAIVKWFNVVDFDRLNGRPNEQLNLGETFNRIRNFMYSPNSAGEHMMQNGAMFAMMYANRLVPIEDYDSKGRLPYRFMTLAQYIARNHENALKQVIAGTPLNEAYNKFVESQSEDDNILKGYARNRRDFATEFANFALNNEQRKAYNAKEKELNANAKEKFEQMPTLMSQLDLIDGKMGFKDGSILKELSTQISDGEVNDAYRLLAEFKGKVIAVNKEIHGVYDRLGAAQLEKTFLGGLVMQYHKHIYPGILKHWRKHGYFNEELGTNVIGCGPALYDFITMPFRRYNERKKTLTPEQIESLEGTRNLFKAYIDFAENIKVNWSMLPEYQKAAIRRAAGDIFGVLAAMCVALATRIVWDDDEMKESSIANMLIYQADSLASQSMMFNPVFVPGQAKTLWSSPVAMMNGVSDIYDSMNLIASAMIDDDFDWNYTTGRYKGENKFTVRLTRQIPIYRQYQNLANMNQSNSFYNRSEHMLTFIPIKQIADDIAGR